MNADQRFAEIRSQHGHVDPGEIPGLKFVPAVEVDELLFLSGEGPRLGNEFKYQGKVPDDVRIDDAIQAAYLSGLNLILPHRRSLERWNESAK